MIVSIKCRTAAIMQDQGHFDDHFSGSPANDGSWHHIALTWQSSDGMTRLYDNGRQVGRSFTFLSLSKLEGEKPN